MTRSGSGTFLAGLMALSAATVLVAGITWVVLDDQALVLLIPIVVVSLLGLVLAPVSLALPGLHERLVGMNAALEASNRAQRPPRATRKDAASTPGPTRPRSNAVPGGAPSHRISRLMG